MDILANADLSAMDLGDLLSLAEDEVSTNASHDAQKGAHQEQSQHSQQHIAIIGMAGKIASCADLDAFWQLLHDGKTTRRSLPYARLVDLNEYLRLKGAQNSPKPVHYFEESFLSQIDQFDYRFFGMAKQEANLSDPNQRMFLETAWTCLEHAGYGGQAAKGTSTGVFVGFSADFGDAYRDIVRTLAPDAPEVAVVGNVKSLIAARLAYHLDLHGPSMMIDTACSSGLVALHQACRALQAGDCEMALAGAVKIDLVPVADDPETRIGIKDIQATMASDGRTKTFDNDSEGTSGAEGVIAFLLKPLQQALADGDSVHAVVIGSAINQDGQSVGITAPNMAAQEDLILRALRNAQISPETVSYIEAHGTATRLGDPVEVAGIDRAYRRYTQRRQFCAIGSVKTNIGHMDNGAGLAGVAKVVLAMRHQQIPPSLHFQSPNRKIAFSQSPVYVNDRLQAWQTEPGIPMRAGVNSFGLSGTNCHILLQQAPADTRQRSSAAGPFLLPISATSESALERLLQAWHQHLQSYAGPLQDLCFTAAVGRGHYPHRAAICFHDLPGLRQSMQRLANGERNLPGVAFGFFRVLDEKRMHAQEAGQISEAQKKQLDQQAEELCSQYARLAQATAGDKLPLLQAAQQAYVQGADFPWQLWYQAMDCRRIVLPTYPFAATRCWVEKTEMASRSLAQAPAKQFQHPLLDRCVAQSHQLRLYEVMLGVASHWELGEHKVKGMYILPGTAFVEMMLEVAAQLSHSSSASTSAEQGQHLMATQPLQIEQIVFLRPFALRKGQRKAVQLQVHSREQGYAIQIVSRAEFGESADVADIADIADIANIAEIEAGRDAAQWDVHAQAFLRLTAAAPVAAQDLLSIKQRLPQSMHYTSKDDASRGLEIGDRWNLSVQQGFTRAEHDEVLLHLSLPDIYQSESNLYHYHPALLDTAVNAANHLLGEDSLYLPFAYKKLDIFQRLPSEFYVHLLRKTELGGEACHFDICIFDTRGRVCAQVTDYTVKLVHAHELNHLSYESHLHSLSLQADAEQSPAPSQMPANARVLLVHDGSPAALHMRASLQQRAAQVLEIIRPALGRTDSTDSTDSADSTEEFDYSAHFQSLGLDGKAPLAGLVYALGWQDGEASASLPEDTLAGKASPAALAHDLFDFVSHFNRLKLRCTGNMLLPTCGAFVVADHALGHGPQQVSAAALAALARIVRLENPQSRWRCLDSDVLPDAALLWQELGAQDQGDLLALRDGVRYHEYLASLPSSGNAETNLANASTQSGFVPHKDGIYLISGGLGALGLELARYLSQQGPVSLALIGSSQLPQRDEWEALANDPQTPRKLRHSMQGVLALEKAGSRVEIISADVGDYAQMATVLKDLRETYGRINGVVHAAGRAGEGYLYNKARTVFSHVLRPKMDGAWNLHQLTLADPLDFFIMYSSVATVLRSAGQSDYTAANAYLDRLAQYRRSLGLCGIALCWPAWREVGIAVEYGAVDENEFFAPINNQQAMQLMGRILRDESELPAVVVLSEINQRASLEQVDALQLRLEPSMRQRLQKAINRRQQIQASSASSGSTSAVHVHGLAQAEGQDADPVLATLAQLWSRILGVHELDADESFSEFGGNSILTTQLYTELEKVWPGVVDVVDLFTYTTLREQSAFVRKALGQDDAAQASPAAVETAADIEDSTATAEMDDAELDRVLALLAQGDISAEEAQSLL